MRDKQSTRRKLLAGASAIITVPLVGCISGDDSSSNSESGGNDIQDTDGDGVIDSEDYAPRDPDVQSESDVQSDSDSTDDSVQSSESSDGNNDSSDEIPPENVTYPSYSGTHRITARDNYWAWEFSVEADFTLEYRVINMLDERFDFDVLLYPPSKFEEYRAIASGTEGGVRPQYIDGSAPGVESGVEVTNTQLQSGTYYLVVDNTDLSDAGDWGTEETRQVEVEATTKAR